MHLRLIFRITYEIVTRPSDLNGNAGVVVHLDARGCASYEKSQIITSREERIKRPWKASPPPRHNCTVSRFYYAFSTFFNLVSADVGFGGPNTRSGVGEQSRCSDNTKPTTIRTLSQSSGCSLRARSTTMPSGLSTTHYSRTHQLSPSAFVPVKDIR